MKKIIHIGKKKASIPNRGPFADSLKELGELTLIENGDELSVGEKR